MLGGSPNGSCSILQDSWFWSGSTWQPVAGALPFDAFGTKLAYLPDASQAVLYGRSLKRWIWDGTVWALSSATGPTEFYGGECSDQGSSVLGLVYSPSMHRVLLVGGPPPGEVWSWDGTVWARLWPVVGQSSVSPTPNLGPAIGWDPVSNRLLLFGGIRPMTADSPRDETWAWDGTNWSRLSTGNVPPSNDGGQAIALDPTTGHLLMLDGSQTWSWDGSNWAKIADGLPGPTPNIDGGVLATDPVHRQVIYVGGCTLNCGAPYEGTLVWDGTSWSYRP
jgi:hypothetical protein